MRVLGMVKKLTVGVVLAVAVLTAGTGTSEAGSSWYAEETAPK